MVYSCDYNYYELKFRSHKLFQLSISQFKLSISVEYLQNHFGFHFYR